MSKAVSARYEVPCQACLAAAGEPCRTMTGGRVTDTHQTRIFWNHEYRTGRVSLERVTELVDRKRAALLSRGAGERDGYTNG